MGRRAIGDGPWRIAHLTTVDMSLELLLGPELSVDVEGGHTVVGLSAPGPWVARVEQRGVRHVSVPSFHRGWSLRRDLRAARELAVVLRELRPDVLHTHTPKAGVLGRVVGRCVGVPVIVNTCHGLWATREDRWIRRVLVIAAEALAARCSDVELYQNEDDRRRLAWAVPSSRSETVGNGVDLERFRPDPDERARVRAELGIADDVVVVGGVGRLVREKGIDEFAAMARALADRAEFVWVGPSDDTAPPPTDLRGVRLLGLRHDMRAVYNALDVFVLPSHREGFSRSGMEAAACGCALVLTDIRGCRELGTPGRELMLVPPGDSDLLTAAVRGLLDDRDRRRALGERAGEHARTRFDQRAVAARSLAWYAAVAGRRQERTAA